MGFRVKQSDPSWARGGISYAGRVATTGMVVLELEGDEFEAMESLGSWKFDLWEISGYRLLN